MKYREDKKVSEIYKKNYVDGLNSIIEKRQNRAAIIRKEKIKDVFNNQEKYRDDLKRMLGWPLVQHVIDGAPKTVTERLSEEEGYSIYRMQLEILDGLKMTGLFFKADGDDEKPLVIVQHGGLGTPEIISGVYGGTSNYNDMLQMVRKHDVHIFAPQLLLWSDDYNVKFDRGEIDARLKRVGSSIAAVEIYGIIRILDYFETQRYVSDFGMVGLSYGGFYTLYTAAIDTRIQSAISCSFFNKRDAVSWSDWTWFESAEKFDDAEVAALVYPRNLCLEVGMRDELFDYNLGKESFEKLKEICKNIGTKWVDFIVFNGGHEFYANDEPVCKLITKLKNSKG